MTGEKNRNTTTEKLWNLDDTTLRTPAHDEMVLWLLNKDNIKSLFPEFIDEDIKIISEDPLTAGNGFLVGYLDIVINYNLLREDIPDTYRKYSGINPMCKYIEVKPIISSFGSTLRQLNTYIHYLNRKELHNSRTLTQCNIPVEMYLFTTDLRFKEAFESQGIKVLTYPD